MYVGVSLTAAFAADIAAGELPQVSWLIAETTTSDPAMAAAVPGVVDHALPPGKAHPPVPPEYVRLSQRAELRAQMQSQCQGRRAQAKDACWEF